MKTCWQGLGSAVLLMAACTSSGTGTQVQDAGSTGFELYARSGSGVAQSMLSADDARVSGLTTVAPLKTVAPLQAAAGLATVAPFRLSAVGDRLPLDESCNGDMGAFSRRTRHLSYEILREVGGKKIALTSDHALLDDEGGTVEEGRETQTLEWSSVPASLSCGIELVRVVASSSLRPVGSYRITGSQLLTATEDIRRLAVVAPDDSGATVSTEVALGELYPEGPAGTSGKLYAPWLRMGDRQALMARPIVQSLSILREASDGERLEADIVTRWERSASGPFAQGGERDFVKFRYDRGSQGSLAVSGTLRGVRGISGFVVVGGSLTFRTLDGEGREIRSLTLDSFRRLVGRAIAIRGSWTDARDGRKGTYEGEARPGRGSWVGKLGRGASSEILDLSAWIPLVF